ncbi:hypothetical protein [Nocardia fluminea]|uniref:hypothetical protein n=1 Tax=Nocardia fluminea TaxID=134984 RepID=UPI0036590CED
MTRTLAALALVALAAMATGCGDADDQTAPTTTAPAAAASTTAASSSTAAITTTSAAPSSAAAPIPTFALRGQACRDILPLLDALRVGGQDAATKAGEEFIADMPSRPEWATMSEADRAATIAGIRDAEAGSCQ